MLTQICILCDESITIAGRYPKDQDHLVEDFKKKHTHKSVEESLKASLKYGKNNN